jgi:hypothetical protein|nr:MAG TPA: hypothetical protein [Caudoviricetes sp.]
MTKANEILEIYTYIDNSKEAYTTARERAIDECVEWMACATGGEVYRFRDGSEIRIDEDILYII